MSVSTISTPQPQPQTQPPPAPPVQSDSSSASQTSESSVPDVAAKDGDSVAADRQSSRPPLPPGQGTRVDILA